MQRRSRCCYSNNQTRPCKTSIKWSPSLGVRPQSMHQVYMSSSRRPESSWHDRWLRNPKFYNQGRTAKQNWSLLRFGLVGAKKTGTIRLKLDFSGDPDGTGEKLQNHHSNRSPRSAPMYKQDSSMMTSYLSNSLHLTSKQACQASIEAWNVLIENVPIPPNSNI